MKIAILGRKKDTVNYVNYVKRLGHTPISTLDPGAVNLCDILILPGGGDITPAFYGEDIRGSRNIDAELDTLQREAFERALKRRIPILGICKGMQMINVGLGGTLIQDLPTAAIHRGEKDLYHQTHIEKNSPLYSLYGEQALVNSAHHQAIRQLGQGLRAIQWCPEDHCIEGILHESLPILGLQWHPERISNLLTPVLGEPLLALCVSWAENAGSFCP